ncbi:hypothetical protein [Thermococcus stetteri]|uniref:hypothetical protein n=1 Tax=Thermococcus stetteri TaxID=49900 RepID=UPI001AE494C4|nr:hypothetical protein [Thermococcus stetteri]
MEIPSKPPLVENAVVTSKMDLANLIQKALAQGKGVFLKIFSKDSQNKYYITLLLDSSKVLAAESMVIDTKEKYGGDRTVELLKALLDKPMIVDVYVLDEIELKLTIAENLDAYSETPKVPLSDLLEKASEALKARTIEKPQPSKKVTPEKELGAPEKAEKIKEVKKAALQKEETVTGPEISVNLEGGDIPEEAFRKYAEAIQRDSEKIRGIRIRKIEFDGTVGEGVVYLNVTVYGNSESKNRREIEISERRIFHIVSKNAPIILRVAEYKPILKDIRVVLDGEEVKPREIVDKEKKKTDYVDRMKRIQLSVLEDVWPYFSNFAKTIVQEIESAGMIVEKAYFDIKGRREFEVNLSIVVKGSYDPETAERAIRSIVARHARELSKVINRYISIHTVKVELIQPAGAGPSQVPTLATSSKASEILAKKEALEKEVEQLLKEAGIDELAFLTEEKKKEAEKTLLKSKIEPAIEDLKARIHAELKLMSRVTFKWLKLNHEVQGSTVYVDIEASFTKEEVGGLFGTYSGVSDKKIKQDIVDTITKVIREVSSDYGVSIRLRKLDIILR